MLKPEFEFQGLKVYANRMLPEIPKIQVSEDFKWCTQKARAEMNAWLKERFGLKQQMYVMAHPLTGHRCIVASPQAIEELRRKCVIVNL